MAHHRSCLLYTSVIGSIRTREVERKPYMQKPRDWREGMKHSSTAQTMRHLRVEVMEPVHGLYEFESDDADSGEFTYFFLAPDTSAERCV